MHLQFTAQVFGKICLDVQNGGWQIKKIHETKKKKSNGDHWLQSQEAISFYVYSFAMSQPPPSCPYANPSYPVKSEYDMVKLHPLQKSVDPNCRVCLFF